MLEAYYRTRRYNLIVYSLLLTSQCTSIDLKYTFHLQYVRVCARTI